MLSSGAAFAGVAYVMVYGVYAAGDGILPMPNDVPTRALYIAAFTNMCMWGCLTPLLFKWVQRCEVATAYARMQGSCLAPAGGPGHTGLAGTCPGVGMERVHMRQGRHAAGEQGMPGVQAHGSLWQGARLRTQALTRT